MQQERKGKRQRGGRASLLRVLLPVVGAEIDALLAMEERAGARLRAAGFTFYQCPHPVYQVARWNGSGLTMAAASMEAMDPTTVAGHVDSYPMDRYLSVRAVRVPLIGVRCVKDLVEGHGFEFWADPRVVAAETAKLRDPGQVRRILRSNGYSNREIRRLPLSDVLAQRGIHAREGHR